MKAKDIQETWKIAEKKKTYVQKQDSSAWALWTKRMCKTSFSCFSACVSLYLQYWMLQMYISTKKSTPNFTDMAGKLRCMKRKKK